MAGLVELNKTINTTLKNKFPNNKIYAGEVTEGFYRPSFFVQVIPLRMDYETRNYKSNRLMVSITYFNERDTELENIRMYDALTKTFGQTIQVGKRHLKLWDIRSSDADGALQFHFDLDYWSYLDREEKHELMKELEIKTEKE